MSLPVPFVSPAAGLEPGWVDYNGHLNVAYYNVLFDRALDDILGAIGLGPAYASVRKLSTFTVEVHLCYLAEIRGDAMVQVTSQMLAADAKRIHWFQEMRGIGDGTLHATCEQLSLHVDLDRRRACDFPDDVRGAIRKMLESHGRLPPPERAGRAIQLKGR
jgi:Predicted thioesterase